MSISGLPLLAVLIVIAVLLPVTFGVLWRRGSRRVLTVGVRVLGILLCQILAIAAVFVGVNRSFGFYDSWDDLLGRKSTSHVAVDPDGPLVASDGSQGQVKVLTVHGKVSGAIGQVMVWLPPQYFEHAYAKTNFPVLMALPGQPGTPAGIFSKLNLATSGVRATTSGQVKPFIAVIPPLEIDPPRDTECTDIPHGPQADAWLATDVKEDVIRHFRVTPDHWSTIGWSTGGFCASKMLLRHPTSFSGAASVGGYYAAEEDSTTGNLFNHSAVLRNQNSPLWLIRHTMTYPVHLLIISSTADRESWAGVHYADAQKAVAAAAGIPGVGTILLPTGGHNFSTYAGTVVPALEWLGKNAGL